MVIRKKKTAVTGQSLFENIFKSKTFRDRKLSVVAIPSDQKSRHQQHFHILKHRI